jgi:hypothetical protein
MFRSKTTPPIIMIRDIAFQNLTQEDKHVLSMPRQLSAAGTLVVPGDNLARKAAGGTRQPNYRPRRRNAECLWSNSENAVGQRVTGQRSWVE